MTDVYLNKNFMVDFVVVVHGVIFPQLPKPAHPRLEKNIFRLSQIARVYDVVLATKISIHSDDQIIAFSYILLLHRSHTHAKRIFA